MAHSETELERLRQHGGASEEYLSLLEETAEVMGLSYATLRSRPIELQLMLTKTYVNNWNAGRETLQLALQNITNLAFSAETQLEKQQQAKSSSVVPDDKQKQRAREEAEQSTARQQEAQRQQVRRSAHFSRALLQQEAMRIRQQSRQKQAHAREQEELERSRNKNH